ncbi:HIRAN domain-containing protein [Gracilibacillus lacisalsi]|uniref:HIRAN domain-containing protein n=1 Tax=Gracilibacillus lacisalsi TaxID=393087 RepID=UPI00037DC345|nr:HIRAN domain-containing protein [Gracilibacillus lacisalsi]
MKRRPFVLWLVWQNVETRQRYHIGNLYCLDGKYTFSYELSGKRRTLLEAMENGYRPHLAFRDINKTYTSKRLFDAFARRLPDKRRPDFPELLRTLGLSEDYSEMDLLRATGGRLGTDPYEFVAPIYRQQSHFDFDFYVAGWRYYEGELALNELIEGDEVQFEIEKENPKDSKAVMVKSAESNYHLGYIPAFYSGFMYEVLNNGGKFKATISTIREHAKPQLKVNIFVHGNYSYYLQERDKFDIMVNV